MQFVAFMSPLFAALAVALPSNFTGPYSNSTLSNSTGTFMPKAIPPDVIATKIPQCAQGCVADGLKTIGCDPGDYTCRCLGFDAFWNDTQSCVVKDCSKEDMNKTAVAYSALCSSALKPSVYVPLSPELERRAITSAAVSQTVASIGFVAAAAVFSLAM
ncbi:hypothetical protein GGR51DRAFT_488108 [Nemania sp. FL0031]|nr:hypothetical protein GGR51DRAFT_488108 [Nemania sp. FL0031]